MSQGWYFGNRGWYPDLPIDPPESEYHKYEHKWERWLNDNYDKETKTIFGIDAEDDDKLYDALWDKFMDETVYNSWDD